MNITPEQRQQWREDAEMSRGAVVDGLVVVERDRRILALLDALDAAERERDAWKRTADVRSITALAERVARARALADEWEAGRAPTAAAELRAVLGGGADR